MGADDVSVDIASAALSVEEIVEERLVARQDVLPVDEYPFHVLFGDDFRVAQGFFEHFVYGYHVFDVGFLGLDEFVDAFHSHFVACGQRCGEILVEKKNRRDAVTTYIYLNYIYHKADSDEYYFLGFVNNIETAIVVRLQ